MDNSPAMTQFLYNVSQKLGGEDSIVGQGSRDSQTPDQIQEQISSLMSSPAYTNKMDPGHSSTVDKVQKLFGRLHGAR